MPHSTACPVCTTHTPHMHDTHTHTHTYHTHILEAHIPDPTHKTHANHIHHTHTPDTHPTLITYHTHTPLHTLAYKLKAGEKTKHHFNIVKC